MTQRKRKDVDPKCFGLAEYFTADRSASTDTVYALAENIQQAIEEFFEDNEVPNAQA